MEERMTVLLILAPLNSEYLTIQVDFRALTKPIWLV